MGKFACYWKNWFCPEKKFAMFTRLKKGPKWPLQNSTCKLHQRFLYAGPWSFSNHVFSQWQCACSKMVAFFLSFGTVAHLSLPQRSNWRWMQKPSEPPIQSQSSAQDSSHKLGTSLQGRSLRLFGAGAACNGWFKLSSNNSGARSVCAKVKPLEVGASFSRWLQQREAPW